MSRSIFLALLLFAGPVHADTESDIRAALDYFAETWNSGDLEAIRGFYHPDFVLVNRSGVIPLGQRIDDLEDIARTGEDRRDGSAIEEWFTSVYVKTPFGWKVILEHN